MNKKYLTEIVFQVDDVQSSFYFNANISYVQRNNISKTKRFRDVMFKYSENQTLYSTDFTNLTLEISIKCKTGFYPKLKCTVPCFDNPPIYKCNELGEKICLKGYAFVTSSNECVLDDCALERNFCQNNGTCINDVHGRKCQCPNEYTGTSCKKWDPCLKHKCQNGGRCAISHSTKAYICHCVGNYLGKFCENVGNPCSLLKCNLNLKCIITKNEPKCVKLKRNFMKNIPTTPRTNSSKKFVIMTILKEKNPIMMRIFNFNPITEKPVQLFEIGFSTMAIIVVVIIIILAIIGCVIRMFCSHMKMSRGISVHWTRTSNVYVGANHLNTNHFANHLNTNHFANHLNTHLDNDYDYSNNCDNNYGGSNNWNNNYGGSNNCDNNYGDSNNCDNNYGGSNNCDTSCGDN